MNIQEFIKKREFVYHLTDNRNIDIIKLDGILLSTKTIANRTNLNAQEIKQFLGTRRAIHCTKEIDDKIYHIRDQKPISTKNLQKCLTNGWTVEDFLNLLNSRVFFWPTIKRLNSHYSRYEGENPVIIKVSSSSLFSLNNHAEFSRLNTGATRSNSYLNGSPPVRGEGTFLPSHQYENTIGSIAEVTFPDSCQLPNNFFIGLSPNGPWEEVTL
jgi:hypothetical protein